MDTSQIISVAIFVVAMIAIMTEKVHRALVAITGAMLLLILHIMPFETAIGHIDFNTLGVLFGMMLFVAVVKQSGVFEFLAIKCARVAKGNPWTIMVLFVLLTAVLSAFLDNVTTVLLIGPMTITVCRLLDIDPVPFFMTQILASNIGGTATLIGDPPNIMIGSAAGYTFADFIAYDAPAVIIILAAVIGLFYVMYGRKISANEEHRKAIMELDENDYIKDRRLLHISVAMVVLVVVGFMTHGALGLESCVIALAAAGLILLISGAARRRMDHAVLLRRPVHHRRRHVRNGRHRHAGAGPYRRHGRQPHDHHAGGAVRLGRHLQLPGQHPVRGNHDPHHPDARG